MFSGCKSLLRSLALLFALAAPVAAQSVLLGNGTAASPSLRFNASNTTGMYRFGPDSIGWATAGFARMFLSSTGLNPATDVGASLGTAGLRWSDVRANTATFTGAITANTATFSGAIIVASCTGCGGGSDPSLLSAGTASAPSYSFTSDPNTGMYRFGADTLGFTTAGALGFRIMGSRIQGLTGASCSAPTYSFMSTGTTSGMYFASDLFLCASGSVQAQFSTTDANIYQRINLITDGTAASPGIKWNGDQNTGIYRFGADTIGVATGGVHSLRISGGANATLGGGAGNWTQLAGTGTNRTMTFQATNNSGTATSFLQGTTSGGSSGQALVADGTASAPGAGFINDPDLGMFRHGADTLGFGTGGGSRSVLIAGGSSPVILGSNVNSTNLTFRAGSMSGTTKGFTFQVIDAGGTPQTALTISAASAFTIADPAATGAGDINLCKTTSHVITDGATCGSSSSLIKWNIAPLTSATTRTMALRPSTYQYVPGYYGERKEYGLIAEETAKVDSLLAFYAQNDQTLANGKQVRKGDAYNVNDRAVLALLIATVQEQQRTIALLQARMDSLSKKQ